MFRSILVLFTASLSFSAVATSYPLVLNDYLGRKVSIFEMPKRIVSLMPSSTETVCALGACDRLVGRDTFSNYPPEVLVLPDLGSAFSADLEAIVALGPDLVLADQFSGVAAALDALGITVFAGVPQTIEAVFASFLLLGEVVDRETEAVLLVGRVRGEINEIERLVGGRVTPRTYFELDPTPYSVGPNSFIGVLISSAGGANIVTEGMGNFPQLDPEFIVAMDPEVIVLGDAPFGESLGTIRSRPGWSGLTAVQSGRVAELGQLEVDMMNRPGPRVGEAVRLLVDLLHPDLF
jgi:iron complex transport system substrate-binding protein